MEGRWAPRTSDGAGPQEVDDVHVVPQVSKNLQLRHQSLLLRGVSISCNHTVIIIYIYIIMFFIIVGYLFYYLQLATQLATLVRFP